MLLLFLITGATVYSLSFETKVALKGAVQEKLITVAGIAANEIDGDSFARLQPGDEDTQEFIRGYNIVNDGLLLFFEDNGNGIPDAVKEKIFERGYGTQKVMELFLVREITQDYWDHDTGNRNLWQRNPF